MSPQMFHMCNKELKVTVLSVILDKTEKRKFDYLYQGRIKGGGSNATGLLPPPPEQNDLFLISYWKDETCKPKNTRVYDGTHVIYIPTFKIMFLPVEFCS